MENEGILKSPLSSVGKIGLLVNSASVCVCVSVSYQAMMFILLRFIIQKKLKKTLKCLVDVLNPVEHSILL